MNLLNSVAVWACMIQWAMGQFYPLTKNGEIPLQLDPYQFGDEIVMDCITRNIDNGEHKFDSQERIIYAPFSTCKETGKPLTFKYGVNENVNCTINFSDELYHLFQLYIHEDVPYGCRIPLSTEPDYLEKGGAYVPLTFNFRGEIHDSHLDIDPNLNVFFTRPESGVNTVISSIAYSSSTNVSRVVIGSDVTLSLAVRWFDGLNKVGSQAGKVDTLPFTDGFYTLPKSFKITSSIEEGTRLFVVALIVAVITIFGYRSYVSSKFTLLPKHHKDYEAAVSSKED